MLTSQKLQIRGSEVRQRLNAIAGMDELTDEIRAEADALGVELGDVETRYRAAMRAEGDAVEAAGQPVEDAAAREMRVIMAEADLGRFMKAAQGGAALTGREAELSEHYKLQGGDFPIEMLRQADVATFTGDEPSASRAPLPILFPSSVSQFAGVAIDVVGVGEHAHPILKTGATPEVLARKGTNTESTATFESTTLTPKRIEASVSYTVEDMAVFGYLDSALRQNLAASLQNRI